MTFQKAKEVADNIIQALSQALTLATVHDDISFDQVSQITVRAGSSPELPIYNFLQEQDLVAFTAWHL